MLVGTLQLVLTIAQNVFDNEHGNSIDAYSDAYDRESAHGYSLEAEPEDVVDDPGEDSKA